MSWYVGEILNSSLLCKSARKDNIIPCAFEGFKRFNRPSDVWVGHYFPCTISTWAVGINPECVQQTFQVSNLSRSHIRSFPSPIDGFWFASILCILCMLEGILLFWEVLNITKQVKPSFDHFKKECINIDEFQRLDRSSNQIKNI